MIALAFVPTGARAHAARTGLVRGTGQRRAGRRHARGAGFGDLAARRGRRHGGVGHRRRPRELPLPRRRPRRRLHGRRRRLALGTARRDESHRNPAAVVLRRAAPHDWFRLHHDARRHQAQRRDHVARPGRARPVPHGHRVLGLRPEPSRFTATEHADRADPRLRDRWRERARQWVLGRRVQLLRAAARARRLRRGRSGRRAAVGVEPQARDGWHLVPRDRANVRRADAAAAPRRDRAAVGCRRRVPQPRVPGRHSQRRASRASGRRNATTRRSRTGRVGSTASSTKVGRTARSARRTSCSATRTRSWSTPSTRTRTASPSTSPTSSRRGSSTPRSTSRSSWVVRGRTSRPVASRR